MQVNWADKRKTTVIDCEILNKNPQAHSDSKATRRKMSLFKTLEMIITPTSDVDNW